MSIWRLWSNNNPKGILHSICVLKNKLCRDYEGPELIAQQGILMCFMMYLVTIPRPVLNLMWRYCALSYLIRILRQLWRNVLGLHLQSLGRIKELFLIHHQYITLHTSGGMRCVEVITLKIIWKLFIWFLTVNELYENKRPAKHLGIQSSG